MGRKIETFGSVKGDPPELRLQTGVPRWFYLVAREQAIMPSKLAVVSTN